ncbi:hypothetical protein ATY41_05215 [Leifsonia xyli subsp. xyli]|uniref:Core-binding (CB) domain-containing protein n=1 Tax=Leifsonia xyli subsp. xyli TaxID=59736 RepID=A0A1E2SID3_LEIXY|nr:hypothetical protein [Leifsonia xyli]ODA89491.1 hypothetical protein ATY41_05215 [Leifsonia xyli subsp. xyli]
MIRSKDKAVVVRKLSELRADLERVGDLPTSSQTLDQWMRYWIENVASKRVRPNTLAGYRSIVDRHIIPNIGRVKLDKLSAEHVRRMQASVIEAASSSYALNAHRVLAKALTDAEREGRVTRNVAKLLDAPRRGRTELNALTVQEAIQVIALCVDAFAADVYDPEPARWATYLLTGARRGEILGLERDRVGEYLDLSWQLQRIGDVFHCAG